MNFLNNIRTGVKLITSFVIVSAISLIIAYVGYANMNTINEGLASMYADRLLPISQLSAVNQSLYTIRGDVFKALLIPTEAETSYKTIADKKLIIDNMIKVYKQSQLLDSEKQELLVFDKAWVEYQGAVDEIIAWQKAGNQQQATITMLKNASR